MQKVAEYHSRAEDCRRRAKQAIEDREKKAFEELAAAWELLANARRKQLEEGVVSPRFG
jgi:PIN domain nuclease of toxin-antitoxin system